MPIFVGDESNCFIRLSLGGCESLRMVLRNNKSLKSMNSLRLYRGIETYANRLVNLPDLVGCSIPR